MSSSVLKREDISSQIIHMCDANQNPCHIRDIECRYVYVNSAMRDLLDLSEGFEIEGKLTKELSHWMFVFFEDICSYDHTVMSKKTEVSFLITSAFGRENIIQPYIFDVRPFFDHDGNVVGTMTEVRRCMFFSFLRYIDGGLPIVLKSNFFHIDFTQRDLEVMFFTYHGLTSKETARRLGISHRSVENRLCIMYQRADVHNIYQFREFCRDIGIDGYIPDSLLPKGIVDL